MEIVKLKSAGFCYGVKRAINIAKEALIKHEQPIFTLGPLIHNTQVVERLQGYGIFPINNIDQIDSGSVIIRSHGAPRDIIEKAGRKGIALVDATCPFVKKAQDYILKLDEEGYFCIVVGSPEHPEVKGLKSYAGKDNIMVISSSHDINDNLPYKKIGVVSQTTGSIASFKDIVSNLITLAGEIRVFNTICNTTMRRQQESLSLARNVDCMIVIGGYNSANTMRLTEVCRKALSHTYQVEGPEELDPLWFEGARRIGITGGASTPEWLIDDVMQRIQNP